MSTVNSLPSIPESNTTATKVDLSPDGDQHNSDQESALLDDHKTEGHRRNLISKVARSFSRSRLVSGLRITWRELCSLPWRIAIARSNNWFRYGNSTDYYVQGLPLTHSMRRKYRDVRIRGIQIIRTIHPAATPVDFHILLNSIDLQILLECQDREAELNGSPSLGKSHDKSDPAKRKEDS